MISTGDPPLTCSCYNMNPVSLQMQSQLYTADPVTYYARYNPVGIGEHLSLEKTLGYDKKKMSKL